jgi:hypothetical protein
MARCVCFLRWMPWTLNGLVDAEDERMTVTSS